MESPPLPISASPTVHSLFVESLTHPPLTTDSISSHFTDSGLGISTLRTPSPRHRRSPKTITPSPSKLASISSRLSQLSTLAQEAEEDLDEHTCASVQSQLHAIEAQLEGRTRGNEQTSSDVDLSISNSGSPNVSSASSVLEHTTSPVPAKEALAPQLDLYLSPILTHLTATLTSMRMRLSESKHLHSLTMQKLSSIAQSNVNLTTQLSQSRQTNTSLSHANAALRMRVDDLEAITTQQAVAVSAMTGAVAGLETYVRSSSPNPPSTPRNQPAHTTSKQHAPNANTGARRQTVVRGSGRFRGKYPLSPAYLDRRDSADISMNLDSSCDPRQTELQEGILAWVRGFRDVEAGWKEMDTMYRTPTRFGNGHEDMAQPQMPTRRPEFEDVGQERTLSRLEEESVLLQGDKGGGSNADIFGQDEEFGDFVTSHSNG